MAFDYGSVIAAGINTFGGLAANQINAERAASDMATYLNLVKKQRDWQKEDQQWTEDYAKRLMGYEYENYGSPSAQMAAYKAAGLNPFLASQGGLVGSGQGVKASAAPQPSRVGVSPFERTPLSNPFEGAADKIFGAAQVRSQRIAALSEMAKSVPDLVKGIGKDSAKSVLGAIFGRDVNLDTINGIIQNEALQSDFNTVVSRVQSFIASKYGEKEAANRVALQEQNFNKMSAEIGLMVSEGKVNKAKIDSLMSEYVRNLADAWKLRREGDHYVASAETINAMRELTIASLRNEVTKSGFENRLNGYFEGSGLDDYLHGSYHSKKTADINRIRENRTGSELVQAMDLFFGKWLKVSAAP